MLHILTETRRVGLSTVHADRMDRTFMKSYLQSYGKKPKTAILGLKWTKSSFYPILDKEH